MSVQGSGSSDFSGIGIWIALILVGCVAYHLMMPKKGSKKHARRRRRGGADHDASGGIMPYVYTVGLLIVMVLGLLGMAGVLSLPGVNPIAMFVVGLVLLIIQAVFSGVIGSGITGSSVSTGDN